MRTFLLSVLALCVGFFLFVPIEAHQAPEAIRYAPAYTTDGTKVTGVSARAWGVFDAKTGELLFGHDAEGVHPIASVTKLMTAEAASEILPLDATTTLSLRAIATEGRAGALKTGEEYVIRELLFPLLISSSNDAAEAIAEYGGRDAFIAQMNATAQKLGMAHTAYADPSGLSPSSVSSVADLAKLLAYLSNNRPYLLDVSRLQKYVGKHAWKNVNKTAALDTFRGGKHGFTDEASRTLAALFEEELSSGNKRNVAIVLLGSDNLQRDVETLRGFLHNHLAYQ